MSDTHDLDHILEAMEGQKKTRAELGRLLGLDSSQVTRIFQRRRRIQLHEMRAINEWLGQGLPPSGMLVASPGMVPLYGWTDGPDPDRLQLDDMFMLGFVASHPGQENLRNAFALQVPDDVNSPRYEPGETVYAAPNQRPAPGRWCLVLTKSGKGYLRRFVRRSGEGLELEQIHPPAPMTVKAEDVASVHAIIGTAA